MQHLVIVTQLDCGFLLCSAELFRELMIPLIRWSTEDVPPMNTSDRVLKFAAECQVMAKFSPSSENRAVWRGLAQRWTRCAELMDHLDLEDHSRRSLKRRQGRLSFSWRAPLQAVSSLIVGEALRSSTRARPPIRDRSNQEESLVSRRPLYSDGRGNQR